MNKPILLDKRDFNRVILTETIPFEVPIIFSNDGFYKHCLLHRDYDNYPKEIFEKVVISDDVVTIPLGYKIRKNGLSLRNMSLLHPHAQWSFIDFYKNYCGLICYHSSTSKATIRAPKKIGGSFFHKNLYQDLKKYRTASVDTLEDDKSSQYASSFFAYKGYNRLHKFISSNQFLTYEKRYSSLWTLDVSKCFDSIYTHTMSWAVKSKAFSKAQIPVKSCFGQQFDILMQRSNDNETNGIVIGPESSRIFAEIILQDVDSKSINALKAKHKLLFNKDYVIARYVDDIYIFSVDDDTSRKIAEEFTDHLQHYNLYINELKTVKYSRPFYTINSKIIDQTNTEINNFFAKFTVERTEKGILTLIPSKIFHPDKLINNFVNKIKSICHNTELGCGIASAYIISAIYRRIQKLLRYNINEVKTNPEYDSYYKAAFFVMLKVAFYFYSLEPSVSSSYMLSRIIIITNNFFCIEFPHVSDSIKQKTFELAFQLLKQTHFLKPNHRDDFVPLEKLNIILAISELGHNYLLPPKFLCDLFHFDNGNSGYFQLTTCMYYVKDYPQYSALLPTIKKRIQFILSQNQHHTVSETAFIFLDFLACPYLDLSFREKMLRDYHHYAQLPTLSPLEIANRLTFYENNHWFVKWKGLSLFNALEKKELHSPY